MAGGIGNGLRIFRLRGQYLLGIDMFASGDHLLDYLGVLHGGGGNDHPIECGISQYSIQIALVWHVPFFCRRLAAIRIIVPNNHQVRMRVVVAIARIIVGMHVPGAHQRNP